MEVKFSRSKYTWWNDRINEGCMFERLDRVLINIDFLNIFLVTEAHHLVRQGSDHTLVQIVCNSEVDHMVKPFRFLDF